MRALTAVISIFIFCSPAVAEQLHFSSTDQLNHFINQWEFTILCTDQPLTTATTAFGSLTASQAPRDQLNNDIRQFQNSQIFVAGSLLGEDRKNDVLQPIRSASRAMMSELFFGTRGLAPQCTAHSAGNTPDSASGNVSGNASGNATTAPDTAVIPEKSAKPEQASPADSTQISQHQPNETPPKLTASELEAILAQYENTLITKNYTYAYQASEDDSKTDCRRKSITELKRQAVEEVGSYIASNTVIRDFTVQGDVVRSISEGVVGVSILSEQWNGRVYAIEAALSLNPRQTMRLLLSR